METAERKHMLNLETVRRDVLIAGAALLLVLLFAGSTSGFPLDDSWIHQVYGRNLGLLGQWAFLPGQPSAASTSPLYTVLLALGYRLGIAYPVWTHGIGFAALALAGLLGARLAERMLPHRRRIGVIAGLALVATWHLIWAAASGMETMLFGALTLLVMLLAWQQAQPRVYLLPNQARRAALRRGMIFGAVSALIFLTRPEGAMLAGIAALAVFIANPREIAFWIAGSALGFAVVYAPYALLMLSIGEGLIPATAAAKQAQHAPLLALPLTTRLVQMTLPVLAGGQIVFIFGAAAYVMRALRTQPRHELLLVLMPLVWGVSLIVLYALRLPADYQHGRYVIPALPAFVATGTVGTVLLLQWGRASLLGRVLTQTLVISAALLYGYFALLLGPSVYRTDVQIINEEMVTAAYWIRDNIPADETLAVHDIGAVGYFSQRDTLIDIAGLLSAEVVPLINDEAGLWTYMQNQGAVYLMAFPDQIPGDDPADPRLCFVYSTEGTQSPRSGGANMKIYRLAWSGGCQSD